MDEILKITAGSTQYKTISQREITCKYDLFMQQNSPGDWGSGPTIKLSCKKKNSRDFSQRNQWKDLKLLFMLSNIMLHFHWYPEVRELVSVSACKCLISWKRHFTFNISMVYKKRKWGRGGLSRSMFNVDTSESLTEHNIFLCEYTQMHHVCVMDQKTHSWRVTIIHTVRCLECELHYLPIYLVQ